MGHAWNADILNLAKDDPTDMRDLSFEKNLLANCSIIQAAGMISGPESSGAPVFNVKGEIVGMHFCSIKNFEVCVHVTKKTPKLLIPYKCIPTISPLTLKTGAPDDSGPQIMSAA
ncbi:hypothetical protein QL285_011260 [Trifolium repens]|nr:hypothetical protein QL285_011260 [Trifolium repens]